MRSEIVIDATGGVLGRIAAFAAKQALLGRTVRIVNCREAQITGNKKTILKGYKQKKARGGSALKGPHFPRQSEKIMKRTVRGMLSYKQGRGREALKRIRCYDSLPDEYGDMEKMSLQKVLKVKPMKLSQLSEEL